MFNSKGAKLYRDLIAYVHDNTEFIAKGHKISLSPAFDAADYIIAYFNRSDDLMDNAISYYDPKDLVESHAVNVAIFSLKMSMDMQLSKEDIEDTLVAALFHDVGFGKIMKSLHAYEGIFDEKLLSENDLALVQMHSQYGYEGILYENKREQRITEIILQHHERADGSGYPQQLKDPKQLLPAKIISILDVYETLIHPRPFRDALVPPRGIEAILGLKGSAFTPAMIKTLINSFSLFPIGQYVRLNNGLIGKVIRTYNNEPLRPDVEIHFDHLGQKLK